MQVILHQLNQLKQKIKSRSNAANNNLLYNFASIKNAKLMNLFYAMMMIANANLQMQILLLSESRSLLAPEMKKTYC